MLRAISLFLALMGFWVLLSGQFDVRDPGQRYLLACGVVSCIFVTWVATRKGILDEEGHPIQIMIHLLPYLPWLFLQIVRSNFDVAYRIWHPGRPISARR